MDKNAVKTAGAVFHQLRKQRDLPIGKLSNGIVSISSINKFESGKTRLFFLKLASLLERMDVNLDEYYQRIKPKTLSDNYDKFLNRVKGIYRENDLPTLKKMVEKEPDKDDDLINLIRRATIISLIKDINDSYPVDQSTVEKLHDYLINVEYWGSFEISILNNNSLLLTSAMLKTIAKELLYLQSKNDSEELFSALINIIDVLYRRNDYKSARDILKILENFSLNQEKLIIRFRLTFMKNLLTLNREQAKQGNDHLIESLRSVGSNSMASFYENYMNKYPFP